MVELFVIAIESQNISLKLFREKKEERRESDNHKKTN
jgi:hypothetical protein